MQAAVAGALWWIAFPFQHVTSLVVLLVIFLTYLFGCSRTKRATGIIAASLYLPWIWVWLVSKVSYPKAVGFRKHFFDWTGFWSSKFWSDGSENVIWNGLFSVLISISLFLIPATLVRIERRYGIVLGAIITLTASVISFLTYLGSTN
jgi:hypothetical protein